MADVRDVAQYILERCGKMTAWKLQKLVYYCQAWSLVWDDEPLFEDEIEAWADGPVVRRLYEIHAGKFKIAKIEGGDSSRLNKTQRETIEAVSEGYGDKPSTWLRDLTHSETPWQDARLRAGLCEGERGCAVIPLDAMAEFYGGLSAKGQEKASEASPL
jgi:uncharacterized phage-associated protein